ncbi:hypothetical protein BVY12_16330 [Pseudomonas amygdali pv. morsprunorum]|nr:hypothetical protein BVY12_16330 [Pseudomonas amygdali pv. morsprunorum]
MKRVFKAGCRSVDQLVKVEGDEFHQKPLAQGKNIAERLVRLGWIFKHMIRQVCIEHGHFASVWAFVFSGI